MMFKNTFKLIFSNFSNVWKILLYRIICLLCVLGLTTVVAWPIISVLIKENFFVNLQTSFEGLMFNLNLENIFLCLDNVIKNLLQIVGQNGFYNETIICFVAVFVTLSFLDGYAKIAVQESCNGFMSSLTKYAFSNSYVANFGRATVFNLASLITTLPLNLIAWVGSYLIASNLYSQIGMFAIVLAVFVLVLALAFKNTLFGGWKPAIIVHNKNIFASLKTGFIAVFKRFLQAFSTYLVLGVVYLVLNVFALTLTAGVALAITLPLSTLMFIIADQVMFYTAMGMRFYVDSEHIVSPKRLEQQDKIAKVKHII